MSLTETECFQIRERTPDNSDPDPEKLDDKVKIDEEIDQDCTELIDDLDKSLKKQNKNSDTLLNVSGEHTEDTTLSGAEIRKINQNPEGIFKADNITDKQNINNYEVQTVLSDKIPCVDIDSAKNEKYGSVINVFPGTLVKENCAADFVANTEAHCKDSNSTNSECTRQTNPSCCDTGIDNNEQTEIYIKEEFINSSEDDEHVKLRGATVKNENMSMNVADEKQMKEKIEKREGVGRSYEIVKVIQNSFQ